MSDSERRVAVRLRRPMKNTISGSEGKAFMKIVVAADTDKVVGVHIVGPECAEIIQVEPPLCILRIQHLRSSPPIFHHCQRCCGGQNGCSRSSDTDSH
jgi:pyruvate/2-oxoglutarate dehydrogenase complex dihydrolipoamide dehydrogenase (E3) component